MAKTFEDFENEANEISGRIGKVAGDVAGLKVKIKSLEDLLKNAGMSAADEEKVFGKLTDIKTELGIVDEETPDAEATDNGDESGG